jgi:hypothetical protein
LKEPTVIPMKLVTWDALVQRFEETTGMTGVRESRLEPLWDLPGTTHIVLYEDPAVDSTYAIVVAVGPGRTRPGPDLADRLGGPGWHLYPTLYCERPEKRTADEPRAVANRIIPKED